MKIKALFFIPGTIFALYVRLLFSPLTMIMAAEDNVARPPNIQIDGENQDLDYFRLREIFFGLDKHHSQPVLLGRIPFPFLPFELAQEFLEKFLASIHLLAPFTDPEKYRCMLRQLYSQQEERTMTLAKTVILLLVLANGATLTSNVLWMEALYDRAKAEAASLEDVVNLEAIQISLLMAHYLGTRGRPNSCYLQLGVASRKAYAAGLHKDVGYKPKEATASQQAEERRVTFWALVFLERWVSF